MKRGLIADPTDNVGMVLETVETGDFIDFGACQISSLDAVSMPNKLALVPIAKGEAVRKFGGIIGYATTDIPSGAWVHSHNLASGTKREG